mmetsp:Transcript_28774/g.54614  ORF Transcript_28774/g.54614 Transcript_28774/m.54614 type:complete len:257 (+) Transcript_28774:969-1739(+)
MIRTPGFIIAIRSAVIILAVCSVLGTCSVIKSARWIRSSSSTFSTPILAAFSSPRKGSKASTFIFNPRARSQTMPPILPAPITPSVLPVSSVPMNLDFSHLPAWVDWDASGIWRATANIIAIACSAVVIILPKGVFMTITPFLLAASLSILSVPMPARPITLRLTAFLRIVGVTRVAERMARPSYWLITSASLSLSLPRSGSKSTSIPRSLKIWTAAAESLSEMSTLGAIVVVLLDVGQLRAAPTRFLGASPGFSI